MKCRICGYENNGKFYSIREMMFGYGDLFEYFQCSECACLQIVSVPQDMNKYYPQNYYSYTSLPVDNGTPIKEMLIKLRNIYAVSGRGIIGKLLYSFFPYNELFAISRLHLSKSAKIMDIGCGSGRILKALRDIGFDNAVGIDPYIQSDIIYKSRFLVEKKDIGMIEGSYDLIMMHHSLEHLLNPLEVFLTAHKLLRPSGVFMVRVPLIDSWAWNKYGVNWVQLDAPRHLFIPSRKSIDILAEKTNFKIDRIIYDSTALQIWGSEQYVKGISLESDISHNKNAAGSMFSKKDMISMKKFARKLNSEHKGDQAVFYLSKTNKTV